HTVGIERVLVGAVVPGREYDCDSLIVHLLGRFVDRILGIERTAGAPGIVHHLDVVSLLMVQNVVEARERPEDEQDVAGTEADERGAGGGTRVVAPRRGPETPRDPRAARAVADRGPTVWA